jgi:hypothetical protein
MVLVVDREVGEGVWVGEFGGEEGLMKGVKMTEEGAKTHTHPHIHRQSCSSQTCTAGGDDGGTLELCRSRCWDRLSVGGDRCRSGH